MKRTFFLLLYLAFLITQSSWAQNTVVYKDGVSTINGQAFFPKGIYTEANNTVNFNTVKSHGFNVIMSYYTQDGANHKEILDACEAVGIYALLYINRNAVRYNQTSTIETIVNNFKDHPALYGWYLIDEPGPGYLKIDPDNVKSAAQTVKNNDTKHPIFASVWQFEAVTSDGANNIENEYWDNLIDVDMRQAYYGRTWAMSENWNNGISGADAGYISKVQGLGKEFVSIIQTHSVNFAYGFLSTGYERWYSPTPSEWKDDNGGSVPNLTTSTRLDYVKSNIGDPETTSNIGGYPIELAKMFPRSTDLVRGQIANSLAYGSLGTWSWIWDDPSGAYDDNSYYTTFHYSATKDAYKDIWQEVGNFDSDLISANKQQDQLFKEKDFAYRYVKTSSGKEIAIVVNETEYDATFTLSSLPSSSTFTDLTTSQQVQLSSAQICIPASSGRFYSVGGTGRGESTACNGLPTGTVYEQNFENITIDQIAADAQGGFNAIDGQVTITTNAITGSKSLRAVGSYSSTVNWGGFNEIYHTPVGHFEANKSYQVSFNLESVKLQRANRTGAQFYVMARSLTRDVAAKKNIDICNLYFEQAEGTTSLRKFSFQIENANDYYFAVGIFTPSGYTGEVVIDDFKISGITGSAVQPTSVSLNQSSLSLDGGATQTLTATVLPSDATDKTVSWSSSNESVATVSGGVVTGVSIGNAIITATTVSGGKTATTSINVTSNIPVTSVSMSVEDYTLIAEGQSTSLTATVLPSNAADKSITWTSSNNSVATVSDGVVTAVSNGSATITATSSNSSIKATCAVSVDINTSISKPGFDLVWSEDFDQSNGLDKDNWSHNLQWTAGKNLNSAVEKQAYRSDLAVVSDGKLSITQEKLATPYSDGGTSYSYASGAIQSKAARTVKYGYIEMRAKMPNNGGTWPAFWLMPSHNCVYPPYGTEVDILEYFRNFNPNGFNYGLYSNGYGAEADGWKSVPNSPYTITVGDKLSDTYHTYGLEWTPTELICFYDGTEVSRYSTNTAATHTNGSVNPELGEMVPIDEHYIILNVALSQDAGYSGPIVDADLTPEKATMEVDYVRYYEHNDCGLIQQMEDNRIGTVGKNRLTFEGDNLADVISNAVVPIESSIVSITTTKWSDHMTNNNTGYDQQSVDFSQFNVINGDKSLLIQNNTGSEKVAYSTPAGLFKSGKEYTCYINFAKYIGGSTRVEMRDMSNGGNGTVVSGLTNSSDQWQFNFKLKFTPTNNNYALVFVAPNGLSAVIDDIIISGDVNGNIGALPLANICGPIGTDVEDINIDHTNATLNRNRTLQLTASLVPENITNKSIIWSSSNSSVASVSSSGLVTTYTVGNAIITASSDASPSISDNCTITVTNNTISVSSVTLSSSNLDVYKGNTKTITETISPYNATDQSVNWASSNTSIATVSNGVVTGIEAGSVTITATSNSNSGIKATCSVTVNLPPPPATIDFETSANTSFDASKSTGALENRYITGFGINTFRGSVYASETGLFLPNVSYKITYDLRSLWANGGANFYVVLKSASDGSEVGRVEVLATEVGGTIDDREFLVTTGSKSDYYLEIGLDAGGQFDLDNIDVIYGDTPANAAVTSVSVDPTSLALTTGETSDLNKTILPINATNKNVTWSSNNSSVATVGVGGLVTAISAGTATVTVTTDDGSKTATSNITVTSNIITVPVSGVTVSSTSLDLIVGESSDLNKTVLPSDATNKGVAWSSSNSSVATVGLGGLVTAISAGTAIITVTTDDGAKTATSNITVNGNTTIDPDFHIYLAFGQSNMEGQGTIETVDQTVDSRFKFLSPVTCDARLEGSWYDAIPPLTRCQTGLSPADYFGRTLVTGLPSNTEVGIINVAIGGVKIELFDEDTYQAYKTSLENIGDANATWQLSVINGDYQGNPYRHLVEMAQIAQQTGVIKGIIMHQGESNWGETDWPAKVKNVYDNLVAELNLDPASTPLLVGEIANEDQGAGSGMNNIIATIPDVIPNSYVISSSGISLKEDLIHFDTEGVRELGTRYADRMLSLINGDPDATTITMNSPVNGAIFASGATVNITATANGNLPYIGLNLDGAYNTQDNSSPYSMSVSGLADGTHTLLAFTEVPEGSGNWINSSEITITIGGGTTTVPVTGVTISSASLDLIAGETSDLNKTVLPSDATNMDVTWSSNNSSVATVGLGGLVTAVSAGTATISVTTDDGLKLQHV